MKKIYVALLSAFFCPSLLLAQGATDAFNISQTDLKGTARFMSMGGAFGALGGDITTLIQIPLAWVFIEIPNWLLHWTFPISRQEIK